MTDNLSAVDHAFAASSALPSPEFRQLYITGVVGWALGMVVLFGASWIFAKPETVPIAMLWMISYCWIAYLFGLVLMVIRGQQLKASLTKPLLAYVLPVVMLAAIGGICLAIYPDAGLRSDLITYLPVVLIFYCFGCLWMTFGGLDGGAYLRALLPSLIGGLIILGFITVPAFASDAFRYRTAFQLNAKETKIEDGSMIFNGTLEIRKPGRYEFTAPRYSWISDVGQEGGADFELGEMQWGELGAPEDGAIGAFPLRIIWKKGISPGDFIQSPYEEGVVIEVRKVDEGGRLIYSVTETEVAE